MRKRLGHDDGAVPDDQKRHQTKYTSGPSTISRLSRHALSATGRTTALTAVGLPFVRVCVRFGSFSEAQALGRVKLGAMVSVIVVDSEVTTTAEAAPASCP